MLVNKVGLRIETLQKLDRNIDNRTNLPLIISRCQCQPLLAHNKNGESGEIKSSVLESDASWAVRRWSTGVL